MRIRRSRLTADFVQVPNATARDEAMSHMARGILVELLSRPDGWETTAEDMWRQSVAARGDDSPGRRVFRAAFAELKARGYLVAERVPLAGGRHGTVLTVYDIPVETDVPHAGTPEPPAASGPDKTAGRTGVPHGGTPDSATAAGAYVTAGRTDVPPAGTPEPSDVPPAGTPASPAETPVSAGGTDVPLSDVPHAGTSSRKRSKNTEKKTVGGDGRRPTTGSTGSRTGGCAAPADETGEEVRAAAVACVIALMPQRLRDQLPAPVPRAVSDVIAAELARGITAEQLVARVERRWVAHGYESDAESADGPGLLRPVGVAIALARAGRCTSPRCDDGTDLDTGTECRTCEREAHERREAASRPVQGAFPIVLPTGPAQQPTAPHNAPGAATRGQRLVLRDCDGGCNRAIRTLPAPAPAGLCRECRLTAAPALPSQPTGT